jgi:hypothetical protein
VVALDVLGPVLLGWLEGEVGVAAADLGDLARVSWRR